MRTRSELWQRIREARKRAQITQERLAEEVGVTQSAVGQWEARDSDKRSQPSIASLTAIAKATGAPWEWLMSDQSDLTQAWRDGDKNLPPAQKIVLESPSGEGGFSARHVPTLRWEDVHEWINSGGGGKMLAEQKETLLCPVQCSARTFAVVVQGIQNEPVLRNGEIAFIDPAQDPTNGRLVLVEYGVTEIPRIRQLLSEDKSSGVVKCANPQWPEPPVPLSDVKILGVVIFAGRFIA